MNISANRRVRTPRQWANDALGVRAYEQGLAQVQSRPVELYLQVASACNLDCYMCYEHLRPPELRHGRGLKFLEPELFAKIEREIFPYSSRVTFGVGGEPMLCPQLPDYIERAHAANQHVHVMTNGTLITNSARAEIFARCLSTMEISVDGATKETYERIRVGAKWESLLRNVDMLNEHRMRYAPEDRLHLSLCMVLMKSNVHELPAYVELAREHHVDRVSAWHVIPVTEESQGETLYDDRERADRYLGEARRLAARYGIEVDFVRSFAETAEEASQDARSSRAEVSRATVALDAQALLSDEEKWSRPLAGEETKRGPRLHCHMPHMTAFVFYDGRVFPCCHPLAHTKLHMGDLREESFAEIWNNRQYRNLRAGLAQGDPPPLCKACSIVHGHTPVSEKTLEAEGTDLASYYGERDLAPLEELDAVEYLARTKADEHIAKVEDEREEGIRHSAELERERGYYAERLARIERHPVVGPALRLHGKLKGKPRG